MSGISFLGGVGFWALMEAQGAPICGFLKIEKIDLTLGQHNLILTIKNQARKNVDVQGVFWVVSRRWWGPLEPQMCESVYLRIFDTGFFRREVLAMTLGRCNIILVVLIISTFLLMSIIRNLQIDKWFCCLRSLWLVALASYFQESCFWRAQFTEGPKMR